MKHIVGFFAALLVAGCISASAQDEAARAQTRQNIQRARIAQGVNSGEVTRRERVGLRMEQRHIHHARRRANADGQVTADEQRRLERKQDRANRHIRRAKHNEFNRLPE